MNRTFKYIASCLFIINLFLWGCGEDRSGEYYEKVGVNPWVYSMMNQYYLYYQDMPTQDKVNFFTETETFFTSLLSSKDGKNGNKFSYMTEQMVITRSEERNVSYGLYCSYYQTSDAGSVTARVEYVYPNSPALEAGLKRGDLILKINGKELTTTDYLALEEETGPLSFLLKGSQTEQSMPAARTVKESPIFCHKTLQYEGKTIHYLMYSHFTAGTADQAETYNDELRNVFASFSATPADGFILDLRYNGGGNLACAQLLGTLLVPEKNLGQVFCSLVGNDKNATPITYSFDKTLIHQGVNLHPQTLYILGTSATASASELIINGLKPYFGDNLVLLGEKTYGKNVVMSKYVDDKYPQYTFWPVTETAYNVNNESDYANGFTPNVAIAKPAVGQEVGELGTLSDTMLLKTLQYIATGEVKTSAVTRSSKTSPVPFDCSSAHRPLGQSLWRLK